MRQGDLTAASASPLDPCDWREFRRAAHGMLDDLITQLETLREAPVWCAMPEATRSVFDRPLPRTGSPMTDVLDTVRAEILPYATGNRHPRFMGWVHGAGTPVGLIAEMIAGALNMNCGGRDHVGLAIEAQITRWMAEVLGYPAGASGVFVTGTSMANFLALIVARTHAAGATVRREGIEACMPGLTAYASREAHGCVAQAMELAGFGSSRLRSIACDAAGRMDVAALEKAIAGDRTAGLAPTLVVGSAGTVNTGAIDPLNEIAELCAHERIWFHVDGAFGALAAFSPQLRPLIAGIERSDSIAFDFHKWGHVPYDAGFLLVRDGAAHKRAFAGSNAYLQRASRGLAAGETWPCDLGPDLSRGARALKTWMTLAVLGTDRLGAAITANCAVARHLAMRIAASSVFEMKAPVALNIVCFGLRGRDRGDLNRELVLDLQESGIAAPSWTTVGGECVIRCAIVNHRTTTGDVDTMFDALSALAKARLDRAGPIASAAGPC